MLDDRQRIPDQHDFHSFGAAREHRRLNVHYATHAEGIAVMFIQGDQVKPQFLGIAILVDIVVVVVGGFFRIEEAIGYRKEGVVLKNLLFWKPSIRTFSEVANFHFFTDLAISKIDSRTNVLEEQGRFFAGRILTS